jgi:uncharacterized membrane protein YbhN (UPF0104 family)
MRAPSGTHTEVPAISSAAPTRSRGLERVFRRLRVACGALLFTLVVVATVRSWTQVRGTISLIEPYELVLAETFVLAGLALSVLTWRRSLTELGSRIRLVAASRVYLLGQLGKYMPGSVWALAAQTELSKRAGVARSRGIAASLVAIGVNVVTGLALGSVLALSRWGSGAWLGVALIAALSACVAALSPPVLTRLVNAGLRAVRRPLLTRDVTWRGIGSASGWSFTSWLSYGLCVWVLAVAVGAPAAETLPLCLAGVPLAMTAGFLVFVSPSGIGIREAVLVWALAPVLERSDGLAVALVARLLFTVADLLAAAAVAPVRFRPSEAV